MLDLNDVIKPARRHIFVTAGLVKLHSWQVNIRAQELSCVGVLNTRNFATTRQEAEVSAIQEIPPPPILWNTKVQYRLHNSPTTVVILSHMNPAHDLPFYFFDIHFNIVLPSMPTPS